jgi:hypothetical protein
VSLACNQFYGQTTCCIDNNECQAPSCAGNRLTHLPAGQSCTGDKCGEPLLCVAYDQTCKGFCLGFTACLTDNWVNTLTNNNRATSCLRALQDKQCIQGGGGSETFTFHVCGDTVPNVPTVAGGVVEKTVQLACPAYYPGTVEATTRCCKESNECQAASCRGNFLTINNAGHNCNVSAGSEVVPMSGCGLCRHQTV